MTTFTVHKTSNTKQRGVVLITSLIFILAISILSFAGLEVSTLQERMAGNFRNQQMAFQGAEAALIEAESYLQNTSNLPQFNGTNGLYPKNSGSSLYDSIDWNDSSSVVSMTNGFTDLSVAPSYFIELFEVTDTNDSVAAGQTVNEDFVYYRITARAKGQSQSAEVILQSVYRIK